MGSSVGSIGGGGTNSSIDASNISMSPSVQNQLLQVKELEGEVGVLYNICSYHDVFRILF